MSSGSARKFCIVSNDGRFWTGSDWADEYPEADLYATDRAAKNAIELAQKSSACAVVENYGLASERKVFCSEAGGA
jgi:hypothetical protein